MGLIKGLQKKVEDPTAPGQFYVIRMLSYFELEQAREARLTKVLERLKQFGDVRSAIPSSGPTAEQARAASEADPLLEYDPETLLRLGVTQWSYDGEVDIAQLDEETAPFLAREIARYSKPGADDLGKGSSRSTGT